MARFVAVALLAIIGCATAQIVGLGGVGLGLGGGLGGIGYGGLGGVGLVGGRGLGVGIGGLGLGAGIGGLGLGAGRGLGLGGLHGGHGLYAVPNYAYNYAVADKLTADQKQVSEVRKGAVTHNQYSSSLVHPY